MRSFYEMDWSKVGLNGLNDLRWVFTVHTGKGEEKCGKTKINGGLLARRGIQLMLRWKVIFDK